MQSADSQLSEFITRTSADAGLARDLLQSHKWDLKNALCAFYVMKGMVPVDSSPPSDIVSSRVSLTIPLVQASLKSSSEPSLSSSAASSPSKLAISRTDVNQTDLLDDVFPKKLSRGISRATDNVTLVSKARNAVAEDFGLASKGSQILLEKQPVLNESAPECTFTLPDLSIHPPDFSQFLEKDLIEKSSLVSLEGAGRLNWWAELGLCQKLWPLATTGDGNCLLHAASLGMWGWHDRLLTLRKALHAVLSSSSFTEAFYRRWRWQTSRQNEAAGLVLCEEEWCKEWQTLLRMASTQPRARPGSADREMSGGKKAAATPDDEEPHVYESLEELHILALAHVLRRPIVVVADTMLKDVTGEPFAPIPFGGIYLPIECRDECHTSPLCLTYDAAHFSALVPMDKETYADKTPQLPTAIPLTDAQFNLLPLQFAVDPGPDVIWNTLDQDKLSLTASKSLDDDQKLQLLRTYLDIVELEGQIRVSRSHDEGKVSVDVTEKGKDIEKMSDAAHEANHSKAHTLPARLDASSKSEESQRSFRRGLSKSFRWFGTLRRSMSRSIRSNFGTLAKRRTGRWSIRIRQSLRLKSRKTDSETDDKKSNQVKSGSKKPLVVTNSNSQQEKCVSQKSVICALLHTEHRHDYQEKIVRNYLITARERFLAAQKLKNACSNEASPSTTTTSSISESAKSDDHYASQCVTSGCLNYGTAATSYLCSSCFSDQKREMDKCEKSCQVAPKCDSESSTGSLADETFLNTRKQLVDKEKMLHSSDLLGSGAIENVLQC